MKKIAFLLVLISLSWTACTPESLDTEAPVILEGNIVPLPTTGTICGSVENNVIYAKSGDSIRFGLTVRDNDFLSQYKLDLHDDFDCHGHARANTAKWSVRKIVDIESSEYQVQEVLGVPLDVTAGNYHCSFSAIDAAGNSSGESIIYTLSILNAQDTIAPSVQMTQPTNSTTAINKGDTLMIQGNLVDNARLSNGRLELLYHSSTGTENSIEIMNIDTAVTTTNYPFEFKYEIPSTWTSGIYDFEIKAFDGVGNAAPVAEVEVTVN